MDEDNNMERKPTAQVGCLAALGSLILALLVGFALGLLRAYIIVDLWAMFITPTWGLQAPSLPATYGLLLLIQAITSPLKSNDVEKEKPGHVERLIDGLTSAMALSIGLLVLWGLATLVHSIWGA